MVTLPHGVWIEGERHQAAELRGPTGADEAFLLELDEASPAARTTALLARCLVRLGPLATVPEEIARSLVLGDREALLLHVHRLVGGGRLQCVLSCPGEACGDPLDVELAVDDLLLPPYGHASEVHEATCGDEVVRFRLPTGADLEAAVPLAYDLQAAARLVLQRCVLGPAPLTDELADELAARLAELDPQAELRLAVECPACGLEFSALLDAADYLFRELGWQRESLFREVHLLALGYHWSEADILALPAPKRRLYLELLAEAS